MLDDGRTGGWLVSGPANLALLRLGTAGGGGEGGGGKYSCVGVDMMPGAGVTTTSPAELKRELGTGCNRG